MNTAKDSNKAIAVAVIGAGIVGLCTALEAQRQGFTVTLVDRDQPGLGASFGNAAYLATELIDPLSTANTLRSAPLWWLDPHGPLALPLAYIHRVLPWLIRFIRAAHPRITGQSREALHQLNQAAVPAWKRCLMDIGATEHLLKSGYLLVWESEKKLQDAKNHADYLKQWGITTELLTADQVDQLEPALAGKVSHALYFSDAYQVKEPYQLCLALFAAFQTRGGGFIQQSVDTIEPSNGQIKLHTPADTLSFNKVIVCAGAWSKSLLKSVGLMVPLEAERGYHLTIENAPIGLNRPIGSAERRFVMSPVSSGLRVVGFTELGGLQLKPIRRRFATLRHHSSQLIASLQNSSLVIQEWMGHRPTLPDSLPVIDHHPDFSNLLFAFGNQHLGVTQAAITAEMIVQLMQNKKPPRDYYRVTRF